MLADVLRRASNKGLAPIKSSVSSTSKSDATAFSNHRKLDKCQNGVLWALYDSNFSHDTANQKYQYLSYSTDEGKTFTESSGVPLGTTAYENQGAIFIDVDDYLHHVYKSEQGYIVYRRGTPNAARTSYSWSGTVTLSSFTQTLYPDLIAHREGTGWVVHVVFSYHDASNNYAAYNRITINSAGSMTVLTAAGTLGNIGGSYAVSTPVYPSIDFHHTGNGKTVAGSAPHLFVSWSAGAAGTGKGTRFRKAAYSAGAWTWGTEQSIDTTRYINSNYQWINTVFDGVVVALVASTWNGTDVVVTVYDIAADTGVLSTSRVIVSAQLYGGEATHDHDRNIYVAHASGTDVLLRKWKRAENTFGQIETFPGVGNTMKWASLRRACVDGRVEFVYTDGSAAPYKVKFGGVNS